MSWFPSSAGAASCGAFAAGAAAAPGRGFGSPVVPPSWARTFSYISLRDSTSSSAQPMLMRWAR